MADNQQPPQIDDNVQDAELVNASSDSSYANRWLWLAIVLLLLLSLASSGWLYQQWQKQEDSQKQLLSALTGEDQALNKALKQNQQQLGNLQQSQQQLSEQVRDLLAREQLSSEEILQQWALQEIGYMLSLANQRAILAQDINGAIHALNLADDQLEKMADYKLHPLRALIAEEVMSLEALADLDLSGMALKLQSSIKRVDNLRVVKGPEVRAVEGLELTPTESTSSWKAAASDIWQQVRSLVVIRHSQNGEQAVLVPEQRYFLYQNLKLQLESARLALLNRDNNSYEYALDTAIEWLNRYFTGDQRDAMIATLEELKAQNINITIPDITESLDWLEEYQR